MDTLPIVRGYKELDREAVLALLRLNTPEYFSPDEEIDFCNYLEHEVEAYFVLELSNEIVGCGGINYVQDKTIATLSWDIIHPHFQGKSFGNMLLKYRLQEIERHASVQQVRVRTTQLVYKFYEKNGFNLLEIVEDYWAKGFHLYSMSLDNK